MPNYIIMISQKHKDTAQWAMEFALQKGCEAARISIITGNNNSFEFRNSQLDKLQQSAENKLYIELFIEGKYGSFSTNRIEKDGLEKFISEGILSTKYLAKDICRQLPKAERYYKNNGADLDSFDSSFEAISTEAKLELVKGAVDEIYGTDERIISVSSSFNDGSGSEYMIASNGFEAETKDTGCSLSVEVSLRTDSDARAESYWYDSAIYWEDLKRQGIGKRALERALMKIGQQKIRSGKYDMLLDNMTASRLLSPMINAMYGSSLQQKNSFLIDKLESQIASDKLTIKDNPHIKRAFGARFFDGEGVATKQQAIIEKGVLKTYFIDTYNSLKMNVAPTISSPSIIEVELGKNNLETIRKSMNRGIWITGFNGGNSNATTGDFSFGVEGFLVENGIVTTPIGEMNITGNLLTLWNDLLEVGSDPRMNSSWRLPSLLFKDVNFSGL